MGRLSKAFTAFASNVSRWTGRPMTFVACIGLVLLWAVSGPLFKFSDTWQLVINTSTTIITFLMVFLIQNTQNRDSQAMHAKLDELLRVSKGSNTYIGVENLPDEELEKILAELDANNPNLENRKAALARNPRARERSRDEAKAQPRRKAS